MIDNVESVPLVLAEPWPDFFLAPERGTRAALEIAVTDQTQVVNIFARHAKENVQQTWSLRILWIFGLN